MAIKGNSENTRQHGRSGEATIAAVSANAGACECTDHPRGIHLPDAAMITIADVHISVAIDRHAVSKGEAGGSCWLAVADVASGEGAYSVGGGGVRRHADGS